MRSIERSVFVLCSMLLSFGRDVGASILCDSGFCRTYSFEVGCTPAAPSCGINNATHTGLSLLSPTTCNCCDFCLPFFVEHAACSLGGPGTGTTVGRCGDGLSCQAADDGHSYCRRMTSMCHSAQDEYDARHARGETGALEQRPLCDGKAKYAAFSCVPTQTCFCQSEEGERIFGEALYVGTSTAQSMHCGCSRLHEKIKKTISPGVPHPVIGPRCTSNGNFNPVQCIHRKCYCVNPITGVIREGRGNVINLNEEPLSKLSCYDAALDNFPSQNDGEPPYNYTTPCFERMQERIEFIQQSEEDGYIMDFFSSVPECLPDGTFGRVEITWNGSKICVDENGNQIQKFETHPYSPEYNSMDCKCAQTYNIMTTSIERPLCCKNGNFRRVQCRRGMCHCVDSDGRQIGRESADVTALPCYTEGWREC